MRKQKNTKKPGAEDICTKMMAKIDALQGSPRSSGPAAARPAGRSTGFCKQLGMLLAREWRGTLLVLFSFGIFWCFVFGVVVLKEDLGNIRKKLR